MDRVEMSNDERYIGTILLQTLENAKRLNVGEGDDAKSFLRLWLCVFLDMKFS